MTGQSKTESVALVADWHDRWHRMVLRTLSRKLNGRSEAQDLSQEVYLRLLRADRLDLVRHPQSYVYRVAVNVLQEWRLRAQQSKPHSDDGLEELESAENPEQRFEQKQVSDKVQKALRSLPPESRMALVLHCRDDMTYQQIADHMQVTRRMVKRYVANGYSALRAHMEITSMERES